MKDKYFNDKTLFLSVIEKKMKNIYSKIDVDLYLKFDINTLILDNDVNQLRKSTYL